MTPQPPWKIDESAWRAIQKYARLPLEARSRLDEIYSDYRVFAFDDQEFVRPSDAKHDISDARRKVADLERTLRAKSIRQYAMFHMAQKGIYLGEATSLLRLLEGALNEAVSWVEPKKPGSNADSLRWAAREAAQLFEKHRREPFTLRKECKAYLETFLEHIAQNATSGSISAAIRYAADWCKLHQN